MDETCLVQDGEGLGQLAGVEGRLLSSSYAPGPGHSKHEPMRRELRRIFDEYADGGRVAFDYKTRVYFGQPADTRRKP